MKALIDADIFQYEFGSGIDSEGKVIPWPFVQARVQSRINGIMEATGASEYQLYLTSDDKSNFRYSIATIQPYKGNRSKTEKPYYYHHIRNFLVDHRDAIEVFEMEADDAMGIEQSSNLKVLDNIDDRLKETTPIYHEFDTVICSRDKDLKMIPGWHYSWGCGNQKEKQLWWQNEIEAIRWFFTQAFTGDRVDNIPGLYGVGQSSKLITNLAGYSTFDETYDYVLSEYNKRFGSYAEKFLDENCKLLWILREEPESWRDYNLGRFKDVVGGV